MPVLMTVRNLALAAGALALILMGAWINGLRWESRYNAAQATHQSDLTLIANAAAAQLRVQQERRQALETRLAALDGQHYQELTHAQQTADRLTADLAAARQRLSVRVRHASGDGVPAGTGAAGLGDGAERADIHPEDARAIAAITGDADRCAVKLTALQAWAREIVKRGG